MAGLLTITWTVSVANAVVAVPDSLLTTIDKTAKNVCDVVKSIAVSAETEKTVLFETIERQVSQWKDLNCKEVTSNSQNGLEIHLANRCHEIKFLMMHSKGRLATAAQVELFKVDLKNDERYARALMAACGGHSLEPRLMKIVHDRLDSICALGIDQAESEKRLEIARRLSTGRADLLTCFQQVSVEGFEKACEKYLKAKDKHCTQASLEAHPQTREIRDSPTAQ